MLGLWSGAPSPNVMQLHIAFGADVDAVVQSPKTLRAAGVEPLDFFSQPTDEPSAIGWMPAAAVYFKDPDGHLLEYLAMLPHAPRPEAGIVTYSAWLQTWARPLQT